MDKKSALEDLGVNFDAAMLRFHNNEAMFLKYLYRMPEETLASDAREAFEKGNFDGAASAIHTLKGLLGNLSLDALFEISTDIVAKLRAGDKDTALEVFFNTFLPLYEKAVEGIKKIREN